MYSPPAGKQMAYRCAVLGCKPLESHVLVDTSVDGIEYQFRVLIDTYLGQSKKAITVGLTNEQALQLTWFVRHGLEQFPAEATSKHARTMRATGEAILAQLSTTDGKPATDDVAQFKRWDGSDQEPLVDRIFPGLNPSAPAAITTVASDRRRYEGNLTPGDSFWCGLDSVRPADRPPTEETHVTVIGQDVFKVMLRRDDGSECQADIEDLSLVLLLIDPPHQKYTVRQWLEYMRPAGAATIKAIGYTVCDVLKDGNTLTFVFDTQPIPEGTDLSSLGKHGTLEVPCLRFTRDLWPFEDSLLRLDQLELDSPFTIVDTRHCPLQAPFKG